MLSRSLWNYYRDEINNNENEHDNNNNRLNNNKTIASKPRYCVISEISRTPVVPANPNANPPVPGAAEALPTSAAFQINNAKFYIPVVTLSVNDNIKFVENTKQGFKITISWNKYRSEITTQSKIII